MSISSDYFAANQVNIHYNLSMMTQVDELESDRHMNMTFTEFLEAVGRVAERLDIPDITTDTQYTK